MAFMVIEIIFYALLSWRFIRINCRLELKSSEGLQENTSRKQVLQRGLLLEFKKDTERVILAVAQRPDGKKNWMVSDQVQLNN